MPEKHSHELIPDEVKKVIQETFLAELQDDVPVEVFTLSGMNDQYNEGVVSIMKTLAGLSDKLKPSFHAVGDARAVKRGVMRSPTVLIAPDKYRLRFTGAPLGEESKTLLIAIMMASNGRTVLSEHASKHLAGLKDRRDIQVYVSPT